MPARARSIASSSGGKRTAWVQHAFSPNADQLYFVNDTGSGPQLTGPLHCTNAGNPCGSVFLDVMPDPTDATKLFAVCQGTASNSGHVVRLDQSGACELIVDGAKLPALSYAAQLALAQ